jgi:hypothetical protein
MALALNVTYLACCRHATRRAYENVHPAAQANVLIQTSTTTQSNRRYPAMKNYLFASVFALTVVGSSATVAKEAAKLVVTNANFNEIMIVNHGSVVKIVDVTINDRTECTMIPPLDEAMQMLRDAAEAKMRNPALYQNPGADLMREALKQQGGIGIRYWRKNSVLQVGETVTVKNNCQGEVVRVKIDTDNGTYQYGY